MGDKVVYFCIL